MSYDQATAPMPSVNEYRSAFIHLNCIPNSYVAMLRAHQNAPNQDITATQLAQAVGYQNFNAANLHYGKLGRYLGEIMGLNPEMMVSVLVTFEYDGYEWHWLMRPQVLQALSQLQWKPCKRKTHMQAFPKQASGEL